MNEYWDEYSEYDSAVESLKDSLRESVKKEVADRIKRLVADNAALKDRLRGLDEAERVAAQTRADYERKFSSIKREAVQAARKEELGKLLDAIDERLYRVERVYTKLPKCDLCNENRQVAYKTPRGRDVTELCACGESLSRWEATEVFAHEVSRRNGELIVWWVSVRRWGHDDQLSPIVLKRAGDFPVADVLKHPGEYSFPDLAGAQALAETLNDSDAKVGDSVE